MMEELNYLAITQVAKAAPYETVYKREERFNRKKNRITDRWSSNKTGKKASRKTKHKRLSQLLLIITILQTNTSQYVKSHNQKSKY